MNKDKYTQWAVEIDNEQISEAIQRIAFSFDYSWSSMKKSVCFRNTKFLIFDPDIKRIQFANGVQWVKDNVSIVVRTFDEVIRLFTNPPLNEKTSLVIDDGKINFNIEISPETRDVIVGYNLIRSELFDRIVKERNALIDVEEPKKKLPKVSFEYKAGPGGNRRIRNILVTSWDIGELTGLDVDDKNKFKKFLFERMITKPELIGFE